MQRKTISTFKNSQECYSAIEKLHAQYKKRFNKNPKADLFYSRGGTDTKPTYSIVVYAEKEAENDIAFFEQLIKENQ